MLIPWFNGSADANLYAAITKAFPDEFHLHTLDLLLSAIARLNPYVDLKKIVIGLMDRLSSYAARDAETPANPDAQKRSEEEAVSRLLQNLELSKEPKKEATAGGAGTTTAQENGVEEAPKDTEEPAKKQEEPAANANGEDGPKPGVPAEAKLYEIFYDQVVNLIRSRGLPIQDTVALLVSLVRLALNTYPDRLEYVDQVLDFATQKTAEYADHADLHSSTTQKDLLHLLLAPVRSYASIFTALALPHYIPLLTSQPYPTRRAIAGELVRSLLSKKTPISTTENLDRVMQALKVLIKEGMQQGVGYPGSQRRGGETDETIGEQGWLARLVHLIQASDNDTQLKVSSAPSIWNAVLLTATSSSYKQPARPMPMGASESATRRQRWSLRRYDWPANSSRASITTITGTRSRQRCTGLCIYA